MNIIYSLAFLWYIPIISGLLFQFPFASDGALKFQALSAITNSQRKLPGNKPGAANMVFISADSGKSWQDVSEGLPENMQGDGFERDGFFANNDGLYIRAGDGIYQTKANSKTPFWKKEIFPNKQGSIAPGNTGIFAYNYNKGQFLQKINGN